jgi:hypothetical protein
MPEPTAGRPDTFSKPHARCQATCRTRPSGPASPTSALLGSESWRGTGAAGQARRRRRPKTSDPAPVAGTFTDRAQASSTVSKAAGCPGVQPPLPHAGAEGPIRRQPGALLLQSGQTLLAHGAGRVIGGLHMQLAALRGASDGDGRPGGRRPRSYALCCVEMQLPIHPLRG